MTRPRIHLIAGARPNFMKVAPVHHALVDAGWADPVLVHGGQHYSPEMSDTFLAELRLPVPTVHLEVGSGTHAEQTGRAMIAYEAFCATDRPDMVVVVGDVNVTVACTLAAAKLCLPVAHLEAGLRSGDRTMPEEVNRIVTDALADLLWAPSSDAVENLLAEGRPASAVELVGNVMLDSLELLRPQIEAETTAADLGLTDKGYAVVTLHRPVNVDHPPTLGSLVDQLVEVAAGLPLVWPVHPRTQGHLAATGLLARLEASPSIHLLPPLGYVRFMGLVTRAALAITDSGGVQEETTYLGIPCLTVRETTERPVTVTEGTNRLVPVDDVAASVAAALAAPAAAGRRPALWDGRTAPRVAESLARAIGR